LFSIGVVVALDIKAIDSFATEAIMIVDSLADDFITTFVAEVIVVVGIGVVSHSSCHCFDYVDFSGDRCLLLFSCIGLIMVCSYRWH